MNNQIVEPQNDWTKSWLNRERFQISQETWDAFKRLKKRFGCQLCGKIFKAGVDFL